MQVLLTVVGTYLGVCAVLWAFQEKLIFHPRPVRETPLNPPAVPIEIARPGAVLRGWVVNTGSDGALVVYFGGNAEEVSRNIPNWAVRKATTVLVNYRGYGDSTGYPGEAALRGDAIAVTDWARTQFPNRPLVLFGQSLGSGIAVMTASAAKPNALILISPYRSVARITRRIVPFVPVRTLLRHRFDAENAVADLPRTLVIASTHDEVIGFQENEAMVEAINGGAREPVELHTFRLRHNQFFHHAPVWRAVDEFLEDIEDREGDGQSPVP